MIKSYSSTQAVVSTSSGESEFYSAVKGTSNGLGLKSMSMDLGQDKRLRIMIDSTAAKAMALRRGLGRARHIETQFLWIQYIYHDKKAYMSKVGTDDNLGDVGTKYLDCATLWKFMTMAGFHEMKGDSKLALREAI